MSAGSRASLKRPQSIDQIQEEVGTDFEEVAVPEDALQSDLSFASVFAGRHTAAPELVIGPQFVLGGATFWDMVVGSLIGNAMAVLAWRFVCAPLAVEKRFSTYYVVKRIFGDKLLALYNVFIALVLGGIAGFMFALAADALSTPFNLPPQTGFVITDPGLLAFTAGTGAFTTIVAMYGFKVVTFVSYWLTPPMFAIIGYLLWAAFDDLGIGFSNFTEQMSTVVYTGEISTGKMHMTFLAIVLTAFVQDQFVHIGCVDLTLFRFARTANAGWQSAWGMYLGHFFLWIGAGVLFRSQVVYNEGQCSTNPDCDPTTIENIFPGQTAYRLGSWLGLLAILFASWSTANPFLYAGGLGLKSGLQVFGLNASTRLVTAIMGIIATIVACFPGLVDFFLLFVQVGGTLLVPVGAIIVADTWILPKMGGQPEFSYNQSADCTTINWAAFLAWGVATGLTCPLAWTGILPGIYGPFINFPLAVIIYVPMSQRQRPKAGLTAEMQAGDS